MKGRDRWWAWGDHSYDIGDYSLWMNDICQTFGVENKESWKAVSLESIKIPDSRIDPETSAAFSKDLNDRYSIALIDRVSHFSGHSFRDIARLRNGRISNPPDAVLYPESEKELAMILAVASRKGGAVIPFGGGSSVVGGVEATCYKDFPWVLSIDMCRMKSFLEIDETTMSARAMSGISGPDLESALNEKGYTLGHFPQSFEFSTLGGWIASRSAGQNSTGYGKIEDMVLGLRMLFPGGEIELSPPPVHACGPDPLQILVGSEGTLGIITEATMRIRKLPREKDYRGFFFRSFREGMEFSRKLMQGEHSPFILRLSDEMETEEFLNLRSDSGRGLVKSAVRKVGSAVSSIAGFSDGKRCFMLLGYEGERPDIQASWDGAERLLSRYETLGLGRSPGKKWLSKRFELPYIREEMLLRGLMVDTLETVHEWGKLPGLYRSVREELHDFFSGRSLPYRVLTHLSHVYSDAGSLYFTFISQRIAGQEEELWLDLKARVGERIAACGGRISHHHGIGSEHRSILLKQIPEPVVSMMKAMKGTLDPGGIMNPGKVVF